MMEYDSIEPEGVDVSRLMVVIASIVCVALLALLVTDFMATNKIITESEKAAATAAKDPRYKTEAVLKDGNRVIVIGNLLLHNQKNHYLVSKIVQDVAANYDTNEVVKRKTNEFFNEIEKRAEAAGLYYVGISAKLFSDKPISYK